jgi:hypothetical protein
MAYYCPFCGEEAYRGHREYKCDNEECEKFGEPIFGHNHRLDRGRYANVGETTPTAN